MQSAVPASAASIKPQTYISPCTTALDIPDAMVFIQLSREDPHMPGKSGH